MKRIAVLILAACAASNLYSQGGLVNGQPRFETDSEREAREARFEQMIERRAESQERLRNIREAAGVPSLEDQLYRASQAEVLQAQIAAKKREDELTARRREQMQQAIRAEQARQAKIEGERT